MIPKMLSLSRNQNKDIWISRYSIYSFKPGEDNKERFETFYHRPIGSLFRVKLRVGKSSHFKVL